METKVEYAVCDECGCDLEEFDEAVVLKDGDVLCRKCMMGYIEGAFADALENVKEVTTGRRLMKKYAAGEERVVYPRERDIA